MKKATTNSWMDYLMNWMWESWSSVFLGQVFQEEDGGLVGFHVGEDIVEEGEPGLVGVEGFGFGEVEGDFTFLDSAEFLVDFRQIVAGHPDVLPVSDPLVLGDDSILVEVHLSH